MAPKQKDPYEDSPFTNPATVLKVKQIADKACAVRVKQIADRLGRLKSGPSYESQLITLTAELFNEVEKKLAYCGSARVPEKNLLVEPAQRLLNRLSELLVSASKVKGERGIASAAELIDLTAGMCLSVYYLWLDPRTREKIENLARLRDNFPILISNHFGETLNLAESRSEFHQMTKSIKLAPPTLLGRTNLSKRSSSAKAKARTILNADQVRAVMDPWILSFTKMVLDSDIPSENDGISDEMREWLLRPKNRWNPTIWAKAFVDYVRSIKPLEEALQYRETGEYDCQLEMSDPLDSPGYISSLFERTAEAPTTDEDLTSPIVLERLTRRLSVATPLQAVALYYKSKRSGEKELFTSLTRAAYAVFAPSFKKQKKQAILARKRKAEA